MVIFHGYVSHNQMETYLDGFYIAQLVYLMYIVTFHTWDAAKKFGFSRYWGLDMIYPLVNVYSLLLKMVI